ncbi:MAG: hypothetical protein GXO27_05105 [Chlorobi bacterium]|nr:hypothetical protein [Chlorobiota bacterium]
MKRTYLSPFEVFQWAWQTLAVNFWRHVLFLFVLGLALTVVSFVLSYILMPDYTKGMWEFMTTYYEYESMEAVMTDLNRLVRLNPFGRFVYQIINLFLLALSMALLFGYGLDTVRGKFEGVKELFRKYVSWGKVLHLIGYILFMFFIVTLPSMVLSFFLAFLFPGKLGFLLVFLVILLFLYILFRLILAPFYIIDRGMSFIDAIAASWTDTGTPNAISIIGYFALLFFAYLGFAFLLAMFQFIVSNPVAMMFIFFLGLILVQIILTLLEIFGLSHYYDKLAGAAGEEEALV